MPHATAFAEHFDQLVRLLASHPEALDEHKEAIRRAREAAAAGDVVLTVTDDRLLAGGQPVTGAPIDPGGLLERFARGVVERLTVTADATSTDLLIAARVLATDGALTELSLRTVKATALRTSLTTAENVLGDGALTIVTAPNAVDRDVDTVALVGRIGTADDLSDVTRVLEETTRRVEKAARDDDAFSAFEALHALVRVEKASTQQGVRLALGVALRRLMSPPTLRLVARLIPRLPDARPAILEVLERAEALGSDALLEHLGAAQSQSDRSAFYNAVLKLPASQGTLVHMLGDSRWYVVRNAADLIGDLKMYSADGALVQVLRHPDERVRKSAITSLGRLGTHTAWTALREVMTLPEPLLRAAGAAALAESKSPYATAVLRRVLGEERDLEVRAAIVAALGRIGSDEAVGLVAEHAQPSRGLLRRNPTPVRLAAVGALALAGSPKARDFLARLTRDRDAEICGAAARALARTRPASGTTGQQTALATGEIVTVPARR